MDGPDQMDVEAARLVAAGTPVVAAVQGAAIGAGFGLACLADFRVGCPEARFAANFARLGYHHILGLSITLPAIVGQQHALDLLYTGRRLRGEESKAIGLCDRLVPLEQVRDEAYAMAADIAASAPLAVRAIRETMRAGLLDRFRAATAHETEVQTSLASTWDLTEGVRAARERRAPRFEGR
jgi:enoyl-CoA hydratase/carnithine racemase